MKPILNAQDQKPTFSLTEHAQRLLQKTEKAKLCLSVDEMGDVLGVSRASAYDLVKREGFPAVIIGRRILVPISSLERWLEEQATNSKAV